MAFEKFKEGFSWLVKGSFNFGKTLTDRFSNSRATGIFDGLAGAGLAYYVATSIVGTVLGIASAAAAITTAPVTALVGIPLGLLFLGLEFSMGGLALGLLSAAREKAGIASPMIVVKNAKNSVTNGAESVSNFFKRGATKLSSIFSRSAGKKSAPQQSPKQPAPKTGDWDF